MDKQKQIDEMAKIMCGGCIENELMTCSFTHEEIPCDFAKNFAEALYNAGYRKIPENAVVLTRGDYEKLLDVRADVILKDIDKVFKEEFEDTKRSMEKKIKPIYKAIETRTRKETAEKFAERLKYEVLNFCGTEEENGYFERGKIGFCEEIDEICKEFTEEEKK